MVYTYLPTRTCMISHTQICTDELVHTCTHIYATAYTSTRKYQHLYMCLIKEQDEHNIGEVCINIREIERGILDID